MQLVKALSETKAIDITGQVVHWDANEVNPVRDRDIAYFRRHPDVFEVLGENALPYYGSEASGNTVLLGPDGSMIALSEAVAVVTRTTTGTAFTGACEFRGFVVRTETGGTADVTIYDATSATGTAIMTVANITTGTYYWDGDHATAGVGNGGRRLNSTGCHVVIAGTCTIDVMVE